MTTAQSPRALAVHILGSAERDALGHRRKWTFLQIIRAENVGDPVTSEMIAEANMAKAALFDAMGWGEPDPAEASVAQRRQETAAKV